MILLEEWPTDPNGINDENKDEAGDA